MWGLAGPAILANTSGPLLGIVDTWALGHLESAVYLGALAVGSIILSAFYWSFGFLRMGTTGLVAQAYGERNKTALAATWIRTALIAVVIGIILILCSGAFEGVAFRLMHAGEAEETLARDYYNIRVFGLPFAFLNLVAIGYLIGAQRPKTALVLQVFLNATNAGLNILFVVGFGLAVKGVAYGSLIAETLTAIAGVCVIVRILGWQHVREVISRGAIWSATAFRRLATVNSDLFVRTILLLASFWIFTDRGATFGSDTLAANHVLMQFFMLTALGLDGFAHAVEALAGEAVGAKDKRGFSIAVRVSTVWAVLTSVAYAGFFFLFGGWLIALMTDIESVRAVANSYLPWAVILPLTGVWCFQFDGIYIGATRTRDMAWTMALALAGYIALIAWLMPIYGNHGLWLAMNLFLILRGLLMWTRYPAIVRNI